MTGGSPILNKMRRETNSSMFFFYRSPTCRPTTRHLCPVSSVKAQAKSFCHVSNARSSENIAKGSKLPQPVMGAYVYGGGIPILFNLIKLISIGYSPLEIILSCRRLVLLMISDAASTHSTACSSHPH